MTERKSRRQRLIKPRLQMRLIVVFLCVASASVLVQAIVLNSSIYGLLTGMEESNASPLAEWPRILAFNVLMTFALMVPATLVVGVFATFKIAGPLYRLEKHCHAILADEDPGDCQLRRSDELQDFCELLNRTVRHLRRDDSATARERDSGSVAA